VPGEPTDHGLLIHELADPTYWAAICDALNDEIVMIGTGLRGPRRRTAAAVSSGAAGLYDDRDTSHGDTSRQVP
jgi:hypothetical protein